MLWSIWGGGNIQVRRDVRVCFRIGYIEIDRRLVDGFAIVRSNVEGNRDSIRGI
jgi:hypothetical protein